MDITTKRIYEAYMRTIGREKRLSEAIKFADAYDGVPIGITDEGVYFLEMDTNRKRFSMTGNVLSPVTEENLNDWERDNVEMEAEYYYNEMYKDHIGDGEREWDDLDPDEQEEMIDRMTEDMVESKLQSMSGSFDFVHKGKTEEYYLDMISAGQLGLDARTIPYPLIPKKEFNILEQAWKQLHLKDLREIEADPEMKKLMMGALQIYQKYEKKQQMMLDKSLQLFMTKVDYKKRGKMLEKILKKKGWRKGRR